MYQIYFILEWHSTCFGRSFHPSSGDSAVCLLASKQTDSRISWWWMERPSETCRVSFQNKINLIHWWI